MSPLRNEKAADTIIFATICPPRNLQSPKRNLKKTFSKKAFLLSCWNWIIWEEELVVISLVFMVLHSRESQSLMKKEGRRGRKKRTSRKSLRWHKWPLARCPKEEGSLLICRKAKRELVKLVSKNLSVRASRAFSFPLKLKKKLSSLEKLLAG